MQGDNPTKSPWKHAETATPRKAVAGGGRRESRAGKGLPSSGASPERNDGHARDVFAGVDALRDAFDYALEGSEGGYEFAAVTVLTSEYLSE